MDEPMKLKSEAESFVYRLFLTSYMYKSEKTTVVLKAFDSPISVPFKAFELCTKISSLGLKIALIFKKKKHLFYTFSQNLLSKFSKELGQFCDIQP